MKPSTIIVDIDGTLSDPKDRLKYITGKNKDWDSFYAECFNDKVIEPTAELVRRLYKLGFHIVILTGRPRRCAPDTQNWLKINNIKFDSIYFRRDLDHSPDVDYKKDILVNRFKCLDDIWFCLEDRARVCDMMRELGLTVYQVAKGDY